MRPWPWLASFMLHRIAFAVLLTVAGAMVASDAAGPSQAESKDTPPPPYQPGSMISAEPKIVATVEGHHIYLQDLGDVLHELPENVQRRPFEKLFPSLLEAAINHAAILLEAQKQNLDAEPDARRRMIRAANLALEDEVLGRVVAKQVTEQAIHARYDQRYGGISGIEERLVRIIVLKTEDEAAQVETELAHGVDFATVARQRSTDPTSIDGGRIGFVRQGQLPPDLAGLVFALTVGAVATTPVKRHETWAIVKVEEHRFAPVPSLDEVRATVRSELAQEAIHQEAQRARAGLRIHTFNLDGTPYTLPSELLREERSKAETGGSR